jgi:hypothetical protein
MRASLSLRRTRHRWRSRAELVRTQADRILLDNEGPDHSLKGEIPQ